MRWILYIAAGIAGLAVLAVLVLLILGGGRGQSRHVATLQIERSPSEVFAWVTEPQRVKAWVGWLVDVRSVTPETAGVGARQVWVMEDRNNNNQRMDIEAEITRWEPDHLVEARLHVPATFTGTLAYELQPIDATRTHLTYRAVYQYEHWLARLLEPLIARSAQHKLEEDLRRLKQLAEAE